MLPRALLGIAVVLGGCAAPASEPSPSVEALPAATPEPRDEGRFDGLRFSIELESDTVRAGAELEGTVVIENRTGEEVVDPSCWLYASSSAIVPPDDPGAELWGQVVVDCAGPNRIEPGETVRDTISFVAATKFGDPLPPGDYVAAVEYRGLSRRLEAAVTVTE